MSINIGTEESPVMVNVALSGGMVDAYVRATDRATFDAAALVAGLTYEVMQTVVDEGTGEATTEGTGEIRTARGVEIHHIGPVVITPAVLDEEGNVVTEAVMDTRHHVNFRMGEPAVSRRDEDGNPLWQKWAAQWTTAGADDTNQNHAEEGKVLMGVSLIDPDTISSKARTTL